MKRTLFLFALMVFGFLVLSAKNTNRPNIILVMADDQGWGQTSYNKHPILKTPNLDKMAENGLRFNRFYAEAPVCSPTRASVLTGRSNDRTGGDGQITSVTAEVFFIKAACGGLWSFATCPKTQSVSATWHRDILSHTPARNTRGGKRRRGSAAAGKTSELPDGESSCNSRRTDCSRG